jgi:chemotaxis-related protein WspD
VRNNDTTGTRKAGEPREVSSAHDAQVTAAPQVWDCWSTIGVMGNATCRELERYVHCRNCPVYSSAALALLDRPVTAEYQREWTEHFAREKKLYAHGATRTSLLLFRIGTEWLALPTPAFQEVAEKRSAHTLPHRRRGIVLGLVNVRGELLICVSLGRLLGLESLTSHLRKSAPRTVFDRLMVAGTSGNRYAFPVDEVHGIHYLPPEGMREPPATISSRPASENYTRGMFSWREHTVGVLSPEVLFTSLNRNLT